MLLRRAASSNRMAISPTSAFTELAQRGGGGYHSRHEVATNYRGVRDLWRAGLAEPARAAVEDEPVDHDARTEGFQGKVQVQKASVALVWLAFLSLSLVSMAAMFKDAKRTHLD